MGLLKSDPGPNAPAAASYNAILDRGSEFEGKLTFEGTVRIDGKFRGEVAADATLVVGETGYVEATIKVRNIVVSGEVVGNIEATEKAELLAPGIVKGNIRTANLSIQEGVVFEGSCFMLEQGGSRPKELGREEKGRNEGKSGSVNP